MNVEHECRQANRCKSRRRDERDQWHGGGVERPGSLCRPCEESAFDAISQLGTDYGQLYAALTEPKDAADQGPHVSKSAGHPIPIRLDVDALMTDIVTELVRWARIVTRGDELPDEAGECVRRCVVLIGANKGTLVDLPNRKIPDWVKSGDRVTDIEIDGVDAVLRLAKLHSRALAVLGRSEVRIWLADPCPSCGRKSLTPSQDQAFIRCRQCKTVWSSDHFAHLGNVLDFERREVKA